MTFQRTGFSFTYVFVIEDFSLKILRRFCFLKDKFVKGAKKKLATRKADNKYIKNYA